MGTVLEEIIFRATIDLIDTGYEGCWVRFQNDVYRREQDMGQLQGADVTYDGKTMATELCQGVLLRRTEMIDIMMAPGDAAGTRKIFPITKKKLRQCWHRTMRRLGLSLACPPQTIRHSGPYEDLARQRCSLEEVRLHGRWKGMDSVKRYTKTSAPTRSQTKVPEETRAR